MKNTIYILFVGLLISCGSVKSDVSDGSIIGTIVHSEESEACDFTIKVVNDNDDTVFYDPINLETQFKKHNLKVVFKFKSLKMANRCKTANPISIITMKKR